MKDSRFGFIHWLLATLVLLTVVFMHLPKAEAKAKTQSKVKAQAKDSDLAILKEARSAFNRKQYDKALKLYLKIPKNSPYWLTSVEERGWARVHLGQKNEAIADTLTLMSPLFSDVASPEAYYLSAYVSHQICDFDRVFKVIESFKKQHSDKLTSLEESQKKAPKNIHNLRVNHYADVIKQLHLIEADAIQRIYLDRAMKGKRDKGEGIEKNDPYALEFPFDENDVWIDEVDQLKVSAKNCPKAFQQVVSR